MKKLLKRFIKLSWHGIPIGIIASVLLCTAVVAAGVLPFVTQTITQEIEEPYVPPVRYTLTMAVNGSGITDPTIGGHSYPKGVKVYISATPASGWEFDSWTGEVADTSSASTTVTMNADKTVTANFRELDYGSITADTITLTSAEQGENVSQSFPGAVIVEVGPDGIGKYLHLKLNTTSDLYSWCGVTLRSYAGDNPIGMNLLINVTYGEIAGMPRDYPHCSVQLTEPGTYTFTETVGAIVGNTSGTAEVKVDITLEDDPAEENTEPF